MRPLLRPLLGLIGLVALLVACSSDDSRDHGGGPITDPMTADALADYWDAGDQAGASLTAADDLWETFAALAADPDSPAAEALTAAHAYAAACTLASVQLDRWAELENRVNSYGGAKSEIDEAARDAALGALEAAADAAMAGGESLVVSWQVLGGVASLRTALADPEGTLPVTGTLAEALAARLAVRDSAVLDAIAQDDDHGGLLPLADIPGVNPDSREAGYLDLDDDHPVKLACRAAVPRWDAAERATSIDLLERAARGRLRLFAAVGAGGTNLTDLPHHLTGQGESAPATHELTLDLRDGHDGQPIGGGALVLLQRLGQMSEQPRLALLDGVSAQCLAGVPAGEYTILVMAEGWARAVAPAVTTSDGLVVSLTLTHLADGALLFDGIEAPAMGGAGGRVDLSAAAASALGDPLSFAWDVRGPEWPAWWGAGPRASRSSPRRPASTPPS
ncbi:MAG: hypothetical protein R3D98_15570 [Candidatus Krumholzibacteriia bacterium]